MEDFSCLVCCCDFECDWNWDTEVDCPYCKSTLHVEHETILHENGDESIIGPWVSGVKVNRMQTLKLSDDLFPAIDQGIKTGTIRAGKREIELGPLMLEATHGSRKLLVEVIRVSYQKVEDLTPSDIAMEGGEFTLMDILNSMRRFYPNMEFSNLVTAIQFKVM